MLNQKKFARQRTLYINKVSTWNYSIYAPNVKWSNHRKQKWTELKGEIDSSSTPVEYLIPYSQEWVQKPDRRKNK